MKLNFVEISYFLKWLRRPSHGIERRYTVRVADEASKVYNEIYDKREKILDKYIQKDKEGKPEMEKDGKLFKIKKGKDEVAKKEVTALIDDEFEIAIDKKYLNVLYSFLDKYPFDMEEEEGRMYDTVMSKLEKVKK